MLQVSLLSDRLEPLLPVPIKCLVSPLGPCHTVQIQQRKQSSNEEPTGNRRAVVGFGAQPRLLLRPISPWLFFNGLFFLSFSLVFRCGILRWPLPFGEFGLPCALHPTACLLYHAVSSGNASTVFFLDFTRFRSISSRARKETSRQTQVQSKRNVSDKAAVDQGTLTGLGPLSWLPWGYMMCST